MFEIFHSPIHIKHEPLWISCSVELFQQLRSSKWNLNGISDRFVSDVRWTVVSWNLTVPSKSSQESRPSLISSFQHPRLWQRSNFKLLRSRSSSVRWSLAYFWNPSTHIINTYTFYLVNIAVSCCSTCIISWLIMVFLINWARGPSTDCPESPQGKPITEDSNSQSKILVHALVHVSVPVRFLVYLFHHNSNIQFLLQVWLGFSWFDTAQIPGHTTRLIACLRNKTVFRNLLLINQAMILKCISRLFKIISIWTNRKLLRILK